MVRSDPMNQGPGSPAAHPREAGQSIIILALGFIALVAFVGIVVDVSLMFVRYSTLSRAVDSAAISAATQMRKERSYADVSLAARQMIELHGLDPVEVKVDTCETAEQVPDGEGGFEDDPAVCRDGRKLVRVGSKIISPTVFMQLLGWEDIELSAVAISETAVLDVVVMFDVSESMLHDTTYQDWANIGLGQVYVPPVWDVSKDADNTFNEVGYDEGVTGQPTTPNGPLNSVYRISAMSGYYNQLEAIYPTRDVDFVDEPLYNNLPDLLQFWDDLLQKPQEVINRRLNYNVPGDPLPVPETPAPPAAAYEVKSFPYDGLPNQGHPRPQCRVRFWPYSSSIQVPEHIKEQYEDYAPFAVNSFLLRNNAVWGGFAPSFDFYGCCNDPTVGGWFNPETGVFEGIRNSDGTQETVTPGSPNGRGDDNFSDLICQPFKQARDATAQFIEQVDFERGDRMAFVTFDRGATIIDPDGSLGGDASTAFLDEDGNPIEPIKDGKTQLTHMIETRDRALDTLYRHVGVRAEANFYRWKENGGGWDGFALGLNQNGQSKYKDFYEISPTRDLDGDGEPDYAANDYPVRDNCQFQNASLTGAFSLYSLWNWNIKDPQYFNFAEDPGLLRIMNPNPNSGQWAGTGIDTRNAYELWAQCRGTNMGAALRNANNALLDPDTTRRLGTVWVLVMLSDGAAGASDPVRLNGVKPTEAKPYELLDDPKGWPDDGSLNKVKHGVEGQYGWFGLCPLGTPAERTRLTRAFTGDDGPSFPYCSDIRPDTRHFCVPLNNDIANVGSSCDPFKLADTVDAYGFAPGSHDNDYECNLSEDVNLAAGNVYDVDIGNYPDENEDTCDPLYDVDDYARDWADHVGLLREGGGAQQLPTIFTIGFGLNFKEGSIGDPNEPGYVPGPAGRNIPDFLGEELLRYIADVGDNNRIDTDYQQDLRDETAQGSLEGRLYNQDRFGLRGPCEDPDVVPDANGIYPGTAAQLAGNGFSTVDGGDGTMVRPLAPRTDCGNYYNAPDQARLTIVFNDIASRMFTRLAP